MKIFEILQKINDIDAEIGTSNVGICNEIVSVDKKGNNGYVKVGIPGDVAQEIVIDPDKKALMLLIIDRKEYDTLKNGDDWTFVDNLPQAVHILTYQLRCDEDYKQSWIANITMSFKDAYQQYFASLTEDSGEIHEDIIIHHIANNAAKQFISNFTQTNAGN
jgi:hypothetical protein